MTFPAVKTSDQRQAGFSLIELIIAMTICLVAMAAASTLLASSFHVKIRENSRSDALAATQRTLNNMSREIANAGYGLADNGLIVADCSTTSIRVRANLNNNTSANDTDEDVRYVFQSTNRVIVRYENSTGASTVVANNISAMTLTYRDIAGNAIASSANYPNAETITIDVRVDLPASQNEPASVVRLVSDVALRNAPNTLDRF
jgi:prepilin-type N-terminal cleavage/methylation domain-containing protein